MVFYCISMCLDQARVWVIEAGGRSSVLLIYSSDTAVTLRSRKFLRNKVNGIKKWLQWPWWCPSIIIPRRSTPKYVTERVTTEKSDMYVATQSSLWRAALVRCFGNYFLQRPKLLPTRTLMESALIQKLFSLPQMPQEFARQKKYTPKWKQQLQN